MNKAQKVVIIGGVACGAKTAARLSRVAPASEVTILERGPDLSYANCGFPFYIGNEVKEQAGLTHTGFGVVRDAEYFRAYVNSKALTGHEAVSIDRAQKQVEVKVAATGELKRFPYDKLVIATGASPIRPNLPGIDLQNVHTLWTLQDTLKIQAALAAAPEKPNVVVVGAGLVGVEAAEAFVQRGANVFLIDALSRPLAILAGESFGPHVQQVLEKNGITFYGDEKVLALHGEGAVKEVETDKRRIPADLVVMSIGVRPNLELARKAELKIGERGIAVNDCLQTSDPDIYAGGDCVETLQIVTGRPTWQPMGSTANRHGRVIADHIAGLPSRFGGVQGTAVVRAFGWTLGKTGLTPEEAKNAGFDPIDATASNPDIPLFMPGSGLTIMRLVADRKTRRILGFQAFGAGRIDKRVDVAATAIKGRLTLDDVADVDLGYAPPFSTALDPLTHAANLLRNKLDGLLKTLTQQQLKARLDSGEKTLVLDVRTPQERAKFGSLPGENLNIPLGELPARIGEVPRDREVVTVCKAGARAWSAYVLLSQAGHTNAKVLEGGFSAWPYEKITLA